MKKSVYKGNYHEISLFEMGNSGTCNAHPL